MRTDDLKVPVKPDTDGLLREVNQEVNRVEREAETIDLKTDIDKDHLRNLKDQLRDVHVDVEFDYKENLREAEAKINEGLKNQNIDIDFDYKADLKEAGRKIDEDLRDRDETIDIDISVNDDALTNFYDDIEKAKRTARDIELEIQYGDELDKLREKLDQYRQLQVGVDINPKDLENRLKDLQRELRNKQVDIALNLKDREALRREIKSIDDDLDDLAKERKVKIDPDLANPSKLNVQRQLAILSRDRVVEFFAKINKASFTKVAAAIGIISGVTGAKNALTDIGDLIADMGKNAPKVAVLATSIAGISTSLFAMAGDAVSLGGSLAKIGGLGLLAPGFLGGFTVSLITLGVAFAGLKKQMPGIYSQFQKLQNVIQKNFWQEAAPALRKLLPVLQDSFGGLATSLGSLIGTIAESLIPDLPEMFRNTAKALDVLNKGAKPIANIFATLGKSGSKYLPVLAQWIDDIAVDFDKWLSAAVKDGRFDKWVQDGVDALKELWSIGQSTWTIIGNISKAAQKAGGSTLKTFADTMQDIADITGSKAFQDGLTSFFKGLEGFQKNFNAKAAGSISGFFTAIGQSSEEVLPKIGTAFGALVDDILSIASNKSLEKGWSSMWTALGQAFSDIKPDMKGIAGGLGTILDIGGQVAKSGIKGLSKILSDIGSGLEDARPGLHDFTKNIGKFIDAFTGKAGSGLKDFTKKLGPLAEQLSRAPWKKMGDALGTLTKAGFKAAGRVLDGITSAVKDANKNGDLKNFADGLGEIADNLDRLAGSEDGVSVLGTVGKIIGWSILPHAQKKSPLLQSITDFLTSLPNVDQLETQALTLLTNIGGKIIDSLVTGFDNAVHKVHDWLKKLTDWIPSWKGPASTDATLLTPVGEQIIQSLVDGFQNKLDAVKTWLQNLTTKIPTWIEGAGTLLLNKGKAIVGGLVSGLKSVAGNVKDEIGKIKSSITDKFSNAKSLLSSEGHAIGQSLATGLRDKLSNVRGAAGDLLSAIRNALRGRSIGGEGRSLGSTFVQGLKDKYSSAYSAGGSLARNGSNGARGAWSAYNRAGGYLGSGLVAGINSMSGAAYSAGYNLAAHANSGFKAKAIIASPSKLFKENGQWLGEGLVLGIESKYDAVRKAAAGMATEASKAVIKAPLTAKVRVSGSAYAEPVDAEQGAATASSGVNVYQTIYNPTIKSDAEAVNDGLDAAGAFGFSG